MFWKIYYQPCLSEGNRDLVRANHDWHISMRFVDSPMPHIVLWDGWDDTVQDVADQLVRWNKDVITILREEGTP